MLIFKAKMKNFGKAQLFFPNKFHFKYRMESDNELCPMCQTPLKDLPTVITLRLQRAADAL